MTTTSDAAALEREDPAGSKASYAHVALRLPMDKEFTYRVPVGMQLEVGNRVRVPFRNKPMPGVVTAVLEQCDIDPAKLLDVSFVVDRDLVLPPTVLALARRVAADYGASLGEALDAALPSITKRRGARRLPHLALNVAHDLAQGLVLDLEDRFGEQSRLLRTVLEFGAPMPVLQAQRRTGTSASPWRTLVKKGILRRVLLEEEGEELVPSELERAIRHELNEHQRLAVEAAVAALRQGRHEVFLLHGVTGSGKTEVYLRILEEVRAAGRSAIVLVPEIALTPQTVGRFASRFADVAVLHSGLTEAQRARHWQRLIGGQASIAIGARSALFAPLANVGLIVVDEEHETSFKQESTPRYHAREMAVVRGQIENAIVVLGSATPSLESYGRARRKSYTMLELPQRAGLGQMPRILVEDLRREGTEARVEGVVLSRTLQVLMKERLATRDQIMLFLNRRGFAPVLICPACGTPTKCAHCDVSMTLHRSLGKLVCHYCSAEARRPELCPVCQHPRLHELGAGTERVEQAIKQLFPEAVVMRMDADTMAQRGAHERVLNAFRRRHIDILIGTQMIAKGLDFPHVTLVGVVSADTGLFVPDYRAAERTFQLLFQVAGRAGRAEKPGTVVLQTFCPDNYAVQAAARLDYESFVQQELRSRRETGYPPFSRLIRVLFEGRDLAVARAAALQVRAKVVDVPALTVLGPAPAVLARVKERHRIHILLKCFTNAVFDEAMARLRGVEEMTTHTQRVILDVDPGSVL